MTYKSYPNSVNTKSRKTRKGSRIQIFVYNKKLAKKLRKERRLSATESE